MRAAWASRGPARSAGARVPGVVRVFIGMMEETLLRPPSSLRLRPPRLHLRVSRRCSWVIFSSLGRFLLLLFGGLRVQCLLRASSRRVGAARSITASSALWRCAPAALLGGLVLNKAARARISEQEVGAPVLALAGRPSRSQRRAVLTLSALVTRRPACHELYGPLRRPSSLWLSGSRGLSASMRRPRALS